MAKWRTRLLEERARAVDLIRGLGRDVESIGAARLDSNVDDEHDPEGVTIAYERSVVESLLRQSRRTLAETAAALVRIEDGTYGVCERCGRPIADARLDARPFSRFCIDHA